MEVPNREVMDIDPDLNYFDEIIANNHVFSCYDNIGDYLQANSEALSNKNYLTIFSQNIRSMNHNLDSFLSLFPDNKMPDAYVLSETWHDLDTPVNIPD